MEHQVNCYTKDGVKREPKDTQVPADICLLIHKMAERIREEKKLKKQFKEG